MFLKKLFLTRFPHNYMRRTYGEIHLEKPTGLCSQPTYWTHPNLIKKNELTPGVDGSEYNTRMINLFKGLPENSACILTSSDLNEISSGLYSKRPQDSQFYYLTGIEEPNCILFLRKASDITINSVIFCEEKLKDDKIYNANITGTNAMIEYFSFSKAYPFQSLDKLSDLLSGVTDCYTSTQSHIYFHNKIMKILKEKQIHSRPIYNILDKLRLIKSSCEINMLRKGSSISCESFKQLIGNIRPGTFDNIGTATYEYHVQMRGGILLKSYLTGGERNIYINSNNNSYSFGQNDIVNMNNITQYNHYTCNVGRCWPITDLNNYEKDIYNILIQSYKDSLVFQPENENDRFTLDHIYNVYCSHLLKNLIDMKIIKNTTLQEAIKQQTHLQFVPTQILRYNGLDYNDCSTIDHNQVLDKGMCFSYSPCIYFNPYYHHIPSEFHGIGVGISNTFYVDQNNNIINLTDLPVSLQELSRINSVL